MKSETLMDALGEIDESYYLPVLPDPLPRKKHRWPLALAAAAMVGLCIIGAIRLQPSDLKPEPVQTEETVEEKAWAMEQLQALVLGEQREFWTVRGPLPATSETVEGLAAFLWKHQEEYASLLQNPELKASLYQTENQKVCVLYLENQYQLLRLHEDQNGHVTDCTTAKSTTWRSQVSPTVVQLVDGARWSGWFAGERDSAAAVGKTSEEQAAWEADFEAAKGAFARWLEDHLPSQALLSTASAELIPGLDYSLELEVHVNTMPPFYLSYFGGSDISFWSTGYLRQNEHYDLVLKQRRQENEIYNLQQYDDLVPGAWYCEDVAYVTERQYLPSIHPTVFFTHRPVEQLDVERALYRFAEDQMGAGPLMAWIDEHGLYTGGTRETPMTGEEGLQMLYDLTVEVLGWDGSVPQAQDPAHPTMLEWADVHQLVTEDENGPFDPEKPLIRAQFAHILRKLEEKHHYLLLPGGKTVCSGEVADRTREQQAREQAQAYLQRYYTWYYGGTEQDLQKGTVLELQEQGMLPEDLPENAVDCVIYYRMKAWNMVQKRKSMEVETENLVLEFDFGETEQYGAFYMVPVTVDYGFDYAGENVSKNGRIRQQVLLIEMEDRFYILDLWASEDVLDEEFHRSGLTNVLVAYLSQ